ncbi:MAG: hypothetical protein P8188_12755 [Gemmatimonadota bacterium]
MKKEWIELVSVFGLLAGLVFVGFEIRQNTKALQGGTVQAAAELQIEMILRGMEDPVIQATWGSLEAGRPMTEFSQEEQMKLGWFFAALTNLEENRFRQIQLETADEEMLGLVNNYLAFAGFREWWEARLEEGLDDRDPAFIAYLDRRMDEAASRAAGSRAP